MIQVLQDVPLKGEVRVVATGDKGTITVSIEVDEEGFPVIDIDFEGRTGCHWLVKPNGDPKPTDLVPKGDQLTVTLSDN